MDPFYKAANSKRFIVEDSIIKVTSDGEPHGMMTIVAVISGLLAAVAILAVLVAVVACKSSQRSPNKGQTCKSCPTDVVIDLTPRSSVGESKRSSVPTIYARISSIPEEEPVTMGNLEGNLNSAFTGSELHLNGSLRKAKSKKLQDNNIQEIEIPIQRY